MKLKLLLGMLFSLAAMNITGCGGGGGGAAAPPPNFVSGTAAAGKFVSGTVNVFSVVANAKAAQVGTAPLDASGNFNVNIGSYTGPALIEVAIGSKYMDEATTTQMTTTAPIRCAISNAATGTTSAMVTPLTELAVMKMADFSAANINANNTAITTTFGLADITKTKPVDATDAAANAAATPDQKKLGLVLAAISQLGNGAKLETVLSSMAIDISGTTLGGNSVVGFKTAMYNFINSANNKTGTTDAATVAGGIGTIKIAIVKINIAGLTAPAKIGAIDFTFNLPVGVTLSKVGTTTEVAPGVVTATGVAAAAGSNSLALATLSGQVLQTRLVNAQGFGNGDFVGISCIVPAGATAPTNTAFTTALGTATFAERTNELGAPITTVLTLSATSPVVVF